MHGLGWKDHLVTVESVNDALPHFRIHAARFSKGAPSTTSVEALWSGGKVWSVSKGVSPGLVGVSQRGLPYM